MSDVIRIEERYKEKWTENKLYEKLKCEYIKIENVNKIMFDSSLSYIVIQNLNNTPLIYLNFLSLFLSHHIFLHTPITLTK